MDRAARSATSLPFVTSVHQKRFRVPYQKLRRLYPSVSKSNPLGETGDVTTAPPLSPEFAGLAGNETLHRVDGIADRIGPDRFRYSSAVGSVVWRWSHATGTQIEQRDGIELRHSMSPIDSSDSSPSMKHKTNCRSTSSLTVVRTHMNLSRSFSMIRRHRMLYLCPRLAFHYTPSSATMVR